MTCSLRREFTQSRDVLAGVEGNGRTPCHRVPQLHPSTRRQAFSGERLYTEIIQAKVRMEQQLGKETDVFCWVGGEEHSYSSVASQLIRNGHYRYAFMSNAGPVLFVS